MRQNSILTKSENEKTLPPTLNPPNPRKPGRTSPPFVQIPTGVREEIKVGSQVAFHVPKAKQSDAEWIQCLVIRIAGDFPKLRYEVQDTEPDEYGHMSQTYKTNAQSIVLIPDDSAGLPALPSGTMVLARYPETTTFYKAEVIATKVCFPLYSSLSWTVD
jgi:SGF29 tudor-like domain